MISRCNPHLCQRASYTLADDVTFERANPNSIRNSFSNGRENARQMRHCISGEMWTCLNRAWLSLRERRIDDIWKTAPRDAARGGG